MTIEGTLNSIWENGARMIWDYTERHRLGICHMEHCDAYLYTGLDQERLMHWAQHGDNPEHRREWPYDSDKIERTHELVDWLRTIHERNRHD